MANKKEPPFNEDKNGPFSFKLPFNGAMELFIETLTGTCFELRVSPFETVACVKGKIQRLEGIPVSQQHLIWNNIELEDEFSLSDYNISEGCTLKLILAMRGGPINTRRVPIDSPVREITEYMDPNREEIWEKVPSNKQVTFLVYREGEQLNFFRVVDRGDGTLTPLSESLSGGSVYNLYPEDEDEAEGSPSGQQLIENAITMNKMKLLKSKMENMNLNKKPKKMSKLKPRPPLVPRPTSALMASTRHRLLRVLPHIGQSCLPPGNSLSSESSQLVLSAVPTLRTKPLNNGAYLNKGENWEAPLQTPSLNSISLQPKVSQKELENPILLKNNVLPPLKKKETLTIDDNPTLHENMNLFCTEENSRTISESFDFLTADPYRNFCTIGSVKPTFQFTDKSKESSSVESHNTMSKYMNSETMDVGINTSELSPPQSRLLSPIHFSSQVAHNTFSGLQPQSKCFEIGSFRSSTAQNLLHPVEVRNVADRSFSRTARFRGVKVESPGKQPEVISKLEARDMTEVANKASKEPVGSLNHLGFFASLTQCTSRDNLHNCSSTGVPKAAITLSNNLPYLQEETLKKMQPSLDPVKSFDTSYGHAETGKNRSSGKSLDAETNFVLHTAMQKLTTALTTTKPWEGDFYKKQTQSSVLLSFQKSSFRFG
ncbi:hypothetical protein GDO86_013218 [Hymenochirus boettgeri]|uniref:Ubiquitin-like domain-containing protein n=1 Tax=Hymenochirus boettgeri TaxID=247094 RepID=A0A8T2ITZ5_9PIPI|nr:hypothetical protein GDO86_013218 [Hymenochirus boettgeri]